MRQKRQTPDKTSFFAEVIKHSEIWKDELTLWTYSIYSYNTSFKDWSGMPWQRRTRSAYSRLVHAVRMYNVFGVTMLRIVTADAYCCMPAAAAQNATASPRHKDPRSRTKESLASSTRWQWSVQHNKRWLQRWPDIQRRQCFGVLM